MLSSDDISALLLSLKLAAVSTVLLVIIGIPLAWLLARQRFFAKPLLEALIALPLVLPPTVLGFYLLIAFSPGSWFGHAWLEMTGSQLAFSFSGLVIGSLIYSLPFVVQPLQISFEAIKDELHEAAACLGATFFDRLRSITLPLSVRGLVTAASLAFAHTMGEFGIVLIIGGNIPDETRVLSIALYDHIESLNYSGAHSVAAFLLFFSFVLLIFVYGFNRHFRIRLGA